MAKRVETELVKAPGKEQKGSIKVILKCNYDAKDKDGNIVIKKPDDEISLPAEEANRLIGMAFAIKA